MWHKGPKKHKLPNNYGMGFWTRNLGNECEMLCYINPHWQMYFSCQNAYILTMVKKP
jgi:hypothetical protein